MWQWLRILKIVFCALADLQSADFRSITKPQSFLAEMAPFAKLASCFGQITRTWIILGLFRGCYLKLMIFSGKYRPFKAVRSNDCSDTILLKLKFLIIWPWWRHRRRRRLTLYLHCRKFRSFTFSVNWNIYYALHFASSARFPKHHHGFQHPASTHNLSFPFDPRVSLFVDSPLHSSLSSSP